LAGHKHQHRLAEHVRLDGRHPQHFTICLNRLGRIGADAHLARLPVRQGVTRGLEKDGLARRRD
jgi:hypothetical protein